jgi:nucleotide-binding universal stress UspA family protein
MKTILAPIDFSTATSRVLDAAVSLALATDGRIVLLHVVQPPLLTSDYGLAMESFQEAIAISEKHSAKRLAELRDQLQSRIDQVTTEQASGAAIPEILEQAKKHQADYIVMGSHGHTALYDLLVGGTTHGILRKAPCPVVIVPPGK